MASQFIKDIIKNIKDHPGSWQPMFDEIRMIGMTDGVFSVTDLGNTRHSSLATVHVSGKEICWRTFDYGFHGQWQLEVTCQKWIKGLSADELIPNI